MQVNRFLLEESYPVLIPKVRLSRIAVLSGGLFILSQMWAQMAMEIHFPLALKVGPVTAVLFLQ